MEEVTIDTNTLYTFLGIAFLLGFMLGKKFMGMIFKTIMIIVFVVAAYYYFNAYGGSGGAQ